MSSPFDPSTPAPADERAVAFAPPRAPRLAAVWAQAPGVAVTLALTFVIGASVAAAANLAAWSGLPTFARANQIGLRARSLLLVSMALGGALPCALVLAAVARWRGAAVARAGAWARLLAPLTLAVALPFFFRYEVFEDRELPFALAATIFGLLLERSLWTSAAHAPAALGAAFTRWRARLATDAAARAARHLPIAVLTIAVVAVAAYLTRYTLLNHQRLQTSSYDLAIFDNMMWNLIHGNGFKASPEVGRVGSHLGVHANFLAVAFTPIYALFPRVETLLVIQAVVVSAAAFPLFLWARLRLGSGGGALALALAYLLFAPMHAAVFYDFHFLTLAPFFVGWVFYFFERGSRVALIAAWIVALLLREDQGAVLAAAGFVLFLEGRRVGWALVGSVVSGVYFVVMKLVVMPRLLHGGGESFTWMYGGLIGPGETGFAGVLRTLGSNPLFVLATVLDADRLVYVLKMFGPVLFLPLRRARTWLLFVPAALFTVLSTHRPLYEPYFQYTCNWASVLFFGAVLALDAPAGPRGADFRFRRATVAALLMTSLVFSYNLGALLQRHTFRGGFRRVGFVWTEIDAQRLRHLHAVIRHLPPGASVAASETEAPHVSAREDCFTLRYMHGDAEYLLVSAEAMDPGTRGQFQAALATPKSYGLVALEGPFTLWKQGADRGRNAEGLRLLGEPVP